LPIEIKINTYPSELADVIEHQESIIWRMEVIIGDLEEARIQAQERIARSQKKQKERHDKIATIKHYNIGDQVLVYRSALEKSWSHKLEEKWEGPFYIH
jgi:hypothetical protein